MYIKRILYQFCSEFSQELKSNSQNIPSSRMAGSIQVPKQHPWITRPHAHGDFTAQAPDCFLSSDIVSPDIINLLSTKLMHYHFIKHFIKFFYG